MSLVSTQNLTVDMALPLASKHTLSSTLTRLLQRSTPRNSYVLFSPAGTGSRLHTYTISRCTPIPTAFIFSLPLPFLACPAHTLLTYTIRSSAKKVGLLVNKKVQEMAGKEAMPIEAVMNEELRPLLARAIMMGNTLLICGQQSATDFAQRFNDAPTDIPEGDPGVDTAGGTKAFFPKEVFVNAGRGLITEEWVQKLYREKELAETSGMAVRKVESGTDADKFRVVCTTWFAPTREEGDDVDEYEEFLFGNKWGYHKPVSQYQVIVIEHEADTALRT